MALINPININTLETFCLSERLNRIHNHSMHIYFLYMTVPTFFIIFLLILVENHISPEDINEFLKWSAKSNKTATTTSVSGVQYADPEVCGCGYLLELELELWKKKLECILY